MPEPISTPRLVRFGVFEVDLEAGELCKQGLKIRLQEKPFQVLALLLEHPGKMVKREAFRQRLWSADTFVEFDHSLSAAVNRLREALGDSANNPRFVETVPLRGYRFIYPVEGRGRASRIRQLRIVALAVVALLAVLIGLNVAGLRERLFGPAPKPITSIAVLPLVNLSGDPEQNYFADGITEALITELGKISALRVIARQSVMQFKGTDASVQEIAQRLNVDAIVEGSVRRIGGRVRISAQLIRANPEDHLWAESFERELTDILALESAMAHAIARGIRIAVTPEEATRLARGRSVDPEAHELYLRGRYLWSTRTEEGLNNSLKYFQRAIEKDSTYSLAYAGLAQSYILLSSPEYGAMAPQEAIPMAKAAALKALQIDESLAEPHAVLGGAEMDYDWDWTGAETEFKLAIALNPGNGTAHHWYAIFLTAMGRHEEAVGYVRRALELDPVSLIINADVGWVLLFGRRYNEAIKEIGKAIELDPNFSVGHWNLGLAYEQKAIYAEAIAEFERAIALSRGSSVYEIALAHAYAVSGRRAQAIAALERIVQLSKKKYVPTAGIALIYAGLGEKEEAFAWLEKAYGERDSSLLYIKVDPRFDRLRSAPRFQSLLRRMNFPE